MQGEGKRGLMQGEGEGEWQEGDYEENWGEDDDSFVDVTVRLCLLRSQEVEWYEGPDKSKVETLALLVLNLHVSGAGR